MSQKPVLGEASNFQAVDLIFKGSGRQAFGSQAKQKFATLWSESKQTELERKMTIRICILCHSHCFVENGLEWAKRGQDANKLFQLLLKESDK